MQCTKIYFLKFISACIIIYKIRPVILKNKIEKMLNLWHSRNIRPSKICASTVYVHNAEKLCICLSVYLSAFFGRVDLNQGCMDFVNIKLAQNESYVFGISKFISKVFNHFRFPSTAL